MKFFELLIFSTFFIIIIFVKRLHFGLGFVARRRMGKYFQFEKAYEVSLDLFKKKKKKSGAQCREYQRNSFTRLL